MLKQKGWENNQGAGLITVQDNTMLKPTPVRVLPRASLITVQDNTMLKLRLRHRHKPESLITVQDNTMLKQSS